MVLVTPVWDVQPCYPVLLDLLIEYPVLLPSYGQLLVDPFNKVLVLRDQLQLAAGKLSGRSTLLREFKNGLQSSSGLDGTKVPTQRTSQVGPGGLFGVLRGRLIPFRGMSNIFSNF